MENSKEYIIEVKNLSKIYTMGNEKIVALDNISIGFKKGKIYCLLGTSGSGKSTLLNMIAGLERSSKGNIIFKGKNIEKMSEEGLAIFRQKYLGFVFQSYNLLPTLTALENVTLPLVFMGVSKKNREKRAREMLKDVGLEKRLKHKPAEMSGGQQQRVSIARAFVNNPEIIFADEPTGNLDTKTTYEMMNLITSKAREYNQTLIIVTHDLEIAEYADEIIYLKDGHIIKTETNQNPKKQVIYNPN
nr:ABC transporter ATP-binding protein [uncultured Tyzzerella sp.]